MAGESPIKLMPTDEVIDSKIDAALEEPLRTLEEHGEAIAGKANASSVYDKTTVDSKVNTVAGAISSHDSNSTRHITAQERESWNNKPSASDIYTRQQSESMFALKSRFDFSTISELTDSDSLRAVKNAFNNLLQKLKAVN